MFVFYFGIMADLTPPVALAAFAAAPIAGASGMKIGVQAVKIALAGFVIPFMAVYSPALLLQTRRAWLDVTYITSRSLIAIGLWGVAAVGYWLAPRQLVRAHLRVHRGRLPDRRRAADRRDRLRAGRLFARVARVARRSLRRNAEPVRST